jgi:transcription elongation factor GreA-like protein
MKNLDEDGFSKYYLEVVEKAKSLGYSQQQVNIFLQDIIGCYQNNKSVDECVEIVF